MAEQQRPSIESGAEHLLQPKNVEQHKGAEQQVDNEAQHQNHGSKEHVASIARSVEQQAVSKEHYSRGEQEQPKNHPLLVNKHLKDMAFERAMTRARKRLSRPSRIFSKIIHNEAIDRTSEAIGKTVARPSAMLGGAFVAFVGTSLLLWATRHYGYEYNYLAVMMLFAGGMLAGLMMEIIVRRVRKNRT